MSSAFGLSDDSPVYVISVAAQLAGLHPQTLRHYDQLGLVSPSRTRGQGRRYSLRDVLALREVQRLSQQEGVNLSGIKHILELEGELRQHQQRLTDVSAELAQLRVEPIVGRQQGFQVVLQLRRLGFERFDLVVGRGA